jgi:hypothetical protein
MGAALHKCDAVFSWMEGAKTHKPMIEEDLSATFSSG